MTEAAPMTDMLGALRVAIAAERQEQIALADRLVEENKALRGRVCELAAALAHAIAADAHPIPALTFDMASLAGLDAARAEPRAVLGAMVGVRLMAANRAALGLFHVNDVATLMTHAGAIFGAALIEPFTRYALAAARGETRFACAVSMHDATGAPIRAELRATIDALPHEGMAPATFALIDAQEAEGKAEEEPHAPTVAVDALAAFAASDAPRIGLVARDGGGRLLPGLLRTGGLKARAFDEPYDAGAMNLCEAILVDAGSGAADDLEAAGRLRAAGARVPLIALSSNASADVRPRFTFAGFDTVLPKPLDVAALKDAIERASQRPWYAIAAAEREKTREATAHAA